MCNSGLIKNGGEVSQNKELCKEKSKEAEIKFVGWNTINDIEKKFISNLFDINSSSTLLYTNSVWQHTGLSEVNLKVFAESSLEQQYETSSFSFAQTSHSLSDFFCIISQ